MIAGRQLGIIRKIKWAKFIFVIIPYDLLYDTYIERKIIVYRIFSIVFQQQRINARFVSLWKIITKALLIFFRFLGIKIYFIILFSARGKKKKLKQLIPLLAIAKLKIMALIPLFLGIIAFAAAKAVLLAKVMWTIMYTVDIQLIIICNIL